MVPRARRAKPTIHSQGDCVGILSQSSGGIAEEREVRAEQMRIARAERAHVGAHPVNDPELVTTMRPVHRSTFTQLVADTDVAPEGVFYCGAKGEYDLENYRAKSRYPGLSPTTVMCPLQGAMSSSRTVSPACNRLVSPSVTVIENTPRSTVNS